MIIEQELIELGFDSDGDGYYYCLNEAEDMLEFKFYYSKHELKSFAVLSSNGYEIDLQFKNKEQLKTFMECFKNE